MNNKNIPNILGITISYLLHPMIISSFTFWYLISGPTANIENSNAVFLTSLFFSTLLPIITFLVLKNRNLISDFNASKKEERLLPMSLGALFFLIGFIILREMDTPKLIQGIMFCGMINTILAWLITKYWKISIHAISLSSSVTIFWIFGHAHLVLSLGLFLILIIARLFANAHNILQIIAGLILGITSTFIHYSILFI
jgi:membrane-associated phospholipid phosphatase